MKITLSLQKVRVSKGLSYRELTVHNNCKDTHYGYGLLTGKVHVKSAYKSSGLLGWSLAQFQ